MKSKLFPKVGWVHRQKRRFIYRLKILNVTSSYSVNGHVWWQTNFVFCAYISLLSPCSPSFTAGVSKEGNLPEAAGTLLSTFEYITVDFEGRTMHF